MGRRLYNGIDVIFLTRCTPHCCGGFCDTWAYRWQTFDSRILLLMWKFNSDTRDSYRKCWWLMLRRCSSVSVWITNYCVGGNAIADRTTCLLFVTQTSNEYYVSVNLPAPTLIAIVVPNSLPDFFFSKYFGTRDLCTIHVTTWGRIGHSTE